MKKQLLEILLDLQKDMKEVKTDIQVIKETVIRIEVLQSEDVVELLKNQQEEQILK
ncbi:hypothetical protein ACFSO7_07180 [Bacillus sp. CGMCC 1.16607]|uniref:hypothetical protein n=1 Tax=Bacillus sp. CGMCC 1.16607 TaxID=3351842 RepID=UPI003638799F